MTTRWLLGPALVVIVVACSRDKTDGLTADGTIELTQTDVSPFVAGRVARVNVEEGAIVRQGDTLALLAQSALPADLDQRRAHISAAEARLRDLQAGARRADIERAEAELRAATAQAERTERDRARLQPLEEQGMISRSQYDAAVAAARVAAGQRDAASEAMRLLRQGSRPEQIAAARAELQNARAALAAGNATATDLVLLAPSNATVLGRYVEPGEVVSPGQIAFTLGDATRPWVRVYLGAAVIPYVRVGQPARVSLQGLGDRTASARVVTIATEAEFTPRVALTENERADLLFGVKLDIVDTTGAFKPGLPATVTIDTSAATTAARKAP